MQPLFSFMISEDGMQCNVSMWDQDVTLYQDGSQWFSTKDCELNIHEKRRSLSYALLGWLKSLE